MKISKAVFTLLEKKNRVEREGGIEGGRDRGREGGRLPWRRQSIGTRLLPEVLGRPHRTREVRSGCNQVRLREGGGEGGREGENR